MAIGPTRRFFDRVKDYVKYRPDYPSAAIDYIKEIAELSAGSPVADIGSGTGIFAKRLLETGASVFGVEPNAAMRSAAEEFLRSEPNFTSIDGTAESTTLRDSSVDLVTAAQAFHWFDPKPTRAEFARILKPSGRIVLIWNERLTDATPFLVEFERFL